MLFYLQKLKLNSIILIIVKLKTFGHLFCFVCFVLTGINFCLADNFDFDEQDQKAFAVKTKKITSSKSHFDYDEVDRFEYDFGDDDDELDFDDFD